MIVDAQLREGSGVSAVEQILRTGFIPHILVSGAKVQALRAGAVLIDKPFFEGVLLSQTLTSLAFGS
jgi:hypothetical protein